MINEIVSIWKIDSIDQDNLIYNYKFTKETMHKEMLTY
jgi:hypothetical protein